MQHQNEWQTTRTVQVAVLDSGRMFKDYDFHKVMSLSARIEEMDALSLNYIGLASLLWKWPKSRETYPRKTVYGIICSIRRFLEEKKGAELAEALITTDTYVNATYANFLTFENDDWKPSKRRERFCRCNFYQVYPLSFSYSLKFLDFIVKVIPSFTIYLIPFGC